LVPGVSGAPQAGQAVGFGARELPQLLQKRTVSAFFAPHCEQTLRSMEAPQLLQNFPDPAGFWHMGQIVVLDSIFPFQTVAFSAAVSMFRCMASARAFATEISWRGAQLTQRPSSSLKSASHTHVRQEWQRWKCC
jgi:hypothetical protein